jgi:hypothetical protein
VGSLGPEVGGCISPVKDPDAFRPSGFRRALSEGSGLEFVGHGVGPATVALSPVETWSHPGPSVPDKVDWKLCAVRPTAISWLRGNPCSLAPVPHLSHCGPGKEFRIRLSCPIGKPL